MAIAIDSLVRDLADSFLKLDSNGMFDTIILEGSSQRIPALAKKISAYLDNAVRKDIKVLREGEGYRIDADYYLE